MSNAIYFICNFLAKTKKLRYICSQIDFIISKTTINMKRINLWMPVAILICSLMMTGLSSCNDVADNPGNRDAQSRDVGYDVDNVKMVESRDVSIKEILEDIIVDHDDLETDEDLIYTEWGKEQLKDLQDDEQILIDLAGLPAQYDRIVMVVNIYQAQKRGQHFGMIRNAFIRLVDARTNAEMCRYDLTENYSGMTAMIFGEIYRHNGEWKFNAIGQGTYDAGIGDLAQRYV